MRRDALIERLADSIGSIQQSHPVRVAIDGPDAAGKTTLADELASTLSDQRRQVIRASIDGFHRPRAERYRQGEHSPAGYYDDSFDYRELRRVLLDPLGPGGTREYRPAVFDYKVDEPLNEPTMVAPEGGVLLFDGVFLLRPELLKCWDYRIFVSVDFNEALRRALDRDVALFGSREEVERRYRGRYIPGQELYFKTARPAEVADLVVRNDDPANPLLIRGTSV